jgi:hypothetical protein
MAHRATVANGYRWRLIIIGLIGVAYAGWAVYDATVAYPAKQDKREVFEQFVLDNGPDPALWAAEARRLGWPIEEPKKIGQRDILTQWVLFGIAFPLGALHLVLWVLWSRRFVEGDEAGIRAHGGRSLTWDQVTAVDAHKWDRKGIAYIDYEADGGKDTVVLDDWKMEREPTDAIFDLVKENVAEEKIAGLGGGAVDADTEDADASEPETDKVREPVDA